MYIISIIIFLVGLASVPLALVCMNASHGLLERDNNKFNLIHIAVCLCTMPLPLVCLIGAIESTFNGTAYVGCIVAILIIINTAIVTNAIVKGEM